MIIYATVATNNSGYLVALKEQFKKYNINLNILGYKKKWKGFNWKIQQIRDFLLKQKENDIVVFMDAFDVLLLNNNYIEERFKSFNKNIVLSVEQLSDSELHQYFCRKVFKPYYNYLINGGLYMGYTKYMLLYFDLINKYYDLDNYQDDQRIFNSFPYQNETIKNFYDNHIGIDIESKIFYNLQVPFSKNPDKHTIKNNKILVNGIEPNFIHAPAKQNINYVLELYNIKIPSNMIVNNNTEQFINNYNIVKYFTKTYYKYFVYEITILFLLLFIILFAFFIFKRYRLLLNNGKFYK